MALEFDGCSCPRCPLHRHATEEIKLPCNSEIESVKRKRSVFSVCKKRKKHKTEKNRSDGGSRRQKYKCKKLRPEAPFNSTQFLMAEYDNLSEKDLTIDCRRRIESLSSLDSDDCTEVSVEEDFITKEFWSAFEDEHAERLDNLPKYQLVQEFLALEEKISALERELDSVQKQDRERIREPSPAGEDEETNPGEVPVDAETAAKIEIFTSEIQKLDLKNESLRVDNIRATCTKCGFPSDCRSISSSDSSDEDPTNYIISTAVEHKRSLKYVNSEESNTDSGMASLEGNTSSSSSEEVKEESQYYSDKSTKGFVSSTTL